MYAYKQNSEYNNSQCITNTTMSYKYNLLASKATRVIRKSQWTQHPSCKIPVFLN